MAVLTHLSVVYQAGDSDLAWTRLTLWRTQLAALLTGGKGAHQKKKGEPGKSRPEINDSVGLEAVPQPRRIS